MPSLNVLSVQQAGQLNFPQQAAGNQNSAMRFVIVVHPESFYRGSTVLTTTLSHVEWVGGPFEVSPGFPLKTCGNDGLRMAPMDLTQQATEN